MQFNSAVCVNCLQSFGSGNGRDKVASTGRLPCLVDLDRARQNETTTTTICLQVGNLSIRRTSLYVACADQAEVAALFDFRQKQPPHLIWAADGLHPIDPNKAKSRPRLHVRDGPTNSVRSSFCQILQTMYQW